MSIQELSTTFQVYAVSDATGSLSNNLAIAAIRQFADIKAKVIRRARINTQEQIALVVAEAKQNHGVIVFTMVSQECRRLLLTEAKKEEVVAMDVMGPTLDMLSHYFHKLPSDEPGLQYKVTQDYFKRTEAMEFAVGHDDGLGLETIHQADIILLGISRTSKTPLSIYLAFQGYRAANVPVVKGIPFPEKLFEIDKKKLVGLIVSPEKLALVRSTRLKKLGRPDSEDYAQTEHIEEELAYAREVFRKIGDIPVIDVTGKAIEEIASEIVNQLRL